MAGTTNQKQDRWIPTACGQCYCMCGIRVRVQDGVVTQVEGNPDAPTGRGSICVKGLASPHLMYDPYRVNYPLKRTNPEKGLGVDPKPLCQVDPCQAHQGSKRTVFPFV